MGVALVTGASGFVGRHAVAELVGRGFTVHAVGRRPVASVPAIWHAADLFNSDARKTVIAETRPTHFLHLAWEARHGYFWEAPENLDWVGSTLDLVRLFLDAGGRRAVFAGSCAEYDWTNQLPNSGVCRESETACQPTTLYGLAKHVTHQLVAAYAARAGLNYAWARMFFLYGPSEAETRFVPSVITGLLEKRPIELGDGQAVRDFLDVRDAGAALAALLDSSVQGPVNLSSGEGVTVGDVADRLARLIGGKDLLSFRPGPAGAKNPSRLVGDVSRLRDEVGFVPLRDLDTGLRDAVAWWRQKRASSGEISTGD